MPKYVLHYFDAAGRGEAIRLIFHHVGVEFEDRRFKREEWPELKKDERLFPFGQAPVLEVDGEVLAQSFSITRFLANEFGLSGKTNMEKFKNDMLVDGLIDIGRGMLPMFKETDETKKAAIKKDFYENLLPKGFQVYEDKFVPTEGFFCGDSVCLADIHFRAMVDMMSDLKGDGTCVLDNFPKAKAFHERIGNSPNIKKYLESKK